MEGSAHADRRVAPEQKRRRLGYTPGPLDIPLHQREREATERAAAEAVAVSAAPRTYDLRDVNGQNFSQCAGSYRPVLSDRRGDALDQAGDCERAAYDGGQ